MQTVIYYLLTCASFCGILPGMKSTQQEQWRPIARLEGLYEISSFGNLRRIAPGKNAKPMQNRRLSQAPNGYLSAEAYVHGRRMTVHIHREVALAFIGPAPAGRPQVNHRDGVKTNNNVANLEWVSQSENMRHAQQVLGWKGRPGESVVQLDHKGQLIQVYPSASKAAQALGNGPSLRKNISLVCSKRHRRVKGPPYRYSVRGYIWMYEKDHTPQFVSSVLAQIRLHRRPNAKRPD